MMLAPNHDNPEALQLMANALSNTSAHDCVCLATDGGFDSGIATYGIAAHTADDTSAIGDLLHMRDASSWTGEAGGLRFALHATTQQLGACPHASTLTIVVIIDNKTCADVAATPPTNTTQPTTLQDDIRHLSDQIRKQCHQLHIVWLPSHGKKPNWRPPPEVTAALHTSPENATALLRSINNAADNAATESEQV